MILQRSSLYALQPGAEDSRWALKCSFQGEKNVGLCSSLGRGGNTEAVAGGLQRLKSTWGRKFDGFFRGGWAAVIRYCTSIPAWNMHSRATLALSSRRLAGRPSGCLLPSCCGRSQTRTTAAARLPLCVEGLLRENSGPGFIKRKMWVEVPEGKTTTHSRWVLSTIRIHQANRG